VVGTVIKNRLADNPPEIVFPDHLAAAIILKMEGVELTRNRRVSTKNTVQNKPILYFNGNIVVAKIDCFGQLRWLCQRCNNSRENKNNNWKNRVIGSFHDNPPSEMMNSF